MKLSGGPVSDPMAMICEVSGKETLKALAEHQAARVLIDGLVLSRCVKNVTQAEMALRMNCVQSKISKMEASVDAALSFGDIVKYAHALGMSIGVRVASGKSKGIDRIRSHAESIKQEVSRLVDLAGDDKAIGDGVESATLKIVLEMLQVIETNLQNLPGREPAQELAPVSVDVEGEGGHILPLDGGPNRARRSDAKKPAKAGCA